MIDIRLETLEFLNNLDVDKITLITIRQTAADLLAYQFYGSSEDGFALANLNDEDNIGFMSGEVKILTQ